MHLLIFLHSNDKIRDANQVDSIVSAQNPEPNTHPLLYETITTCMLHGPCGDEKPEQTVLTEDGYPQYARPNNGRTVEKNGFIYDNRHVVPYNPYLSAK